MYLKSLCFILLHLRDCSFNRILSLIRISRPSPIVIHLLLKSSGYCFFLISCHSKTYFRVPAVTQPVPNVLRLLANLILYSALTLISPKSKCIFLSFSQFFFKASLNGWCWKIGYLKALFSLCIVINTSPTLEYFHYGLWIWLDLLQMSQLS